MNDENTTDQTENTDTSSVADQQASSAEPIAASTEGFSLGKVIEDAKSILTDPTGFYRSMPRHGGFADPVIYVAVMAAALGLLMTVFAIFGADRIGVAEVSGWSFIFLPIMAVIGSFIAALVMFVIWKLMGSDTDYETAYRSVAYAAAIYPIMGVLSIVPYIGTIIGVLWGMYLMYVATIEVHKIPAEKARLVIGTLAVVSLFFQLSAEKAGREISAAADRLTERYEEISEAAERLGGSMDGDNAEELSRAAEQLSESIEERFGNSLKELEGIDQMEPEEAGRKLGEFFKGFAEGVEEFEKGFEEGAGEAINK